MRILLMTLNVSPHTNTNLAVGFSVCISHNKSKKFKWKFCHICYIKRSGRDRMVGYKFSAFKTKCKSHSIRVNKIKFERYKLFTVEVHGLIPYWEQESTEPRWLFNFERENSPVSCAPTLENPAFQLNPRRRDER